MCLKEAIYYEAGNQSFFGKLVVGQVIKNRTEHSDFPDSYCRVIRAKHQFSYYWDGKPEPLPRKNNILEWNALLESGIIAFSLINFDVKDYTDSAVFYHATWSEAPAYTSRLEVTVVVDDHIMYKYKEGENESTL